ncbi:MAG: thiaminase II [Alphaproteobacteria bacterium]|nr:thiaminase II [Alphaproteobacteria bacterium]
MRFSDEAWHQNAALRAAIHKLPFNTELAAGRLSRERFRFYITQDALYLGQYARVLALAAAKGPEIATLQAFASSALGAVAVEQALHGRYLREFGVDPASILAAEPAPDCLAYTSFLIATAYQDPWEILVAALLPCFWIYWDIAQAITRDAAAENPYRAWIDTYADPHFGEAVGRVIGTADKAAAAAAPRVQDGMLGAFRRSAQYEWLFWDGAYNQRCWPAFD